jgi:WD40-like Beta Propeller Repeat
VRTLHRRLPALLPLAPVLACRQDSDQLAFQLQADRFATSEWSDPVNLGPVVNSSANDANAALSPDELTLYFVSARPGGSA